MGRIRGFLILSCTAVLVLSFQNCAKGPGVIETDGLTGNVGEQTAGSLKVTSNVQLFNSSGFAQQSLKATRYVNPVAIRFGSVAQDFSYNFPFSLDLASGDIKSLSNGQVVGQLTASEADQLDVILGDAVVASRRDYMSPDLMCSSVLVHGYASIVTDQGSIILGHGSSSCDVADLFRDDGSSNAAGMKPFLANLSARLTLSAPL